MKFISDIFTYKFFTSEISIRVNGAARNQPSLLTSQIIIIIIIIIIIDAVPEV
jgi:hypothetical protein